ncbi:MAG: tRNA (guanosine(37)-N1)-methyltransferase TrmD [Alphaproteobacteria bacterium]|nr:tRNA (guanosine(37)-N1)-methyltransferase TrmD [Alphaproteobacteria bacterium]
MTPPPAAHEQGVARGSQVPWQARLLTLFPEVFPGVLGHSIAGRALSQGIWQLETVQIRDYALDRHRSVDDSPSGGGSGMVMRADILGRVFDAVPRDLPMIYLSPRGARLTQRRVEQLAAGPGVTLLCGRFEGIDQRVIDEFALEELCLGELVLSGGEIAAMALVDGCVRLLPGVLDKPEATRDESFTAGVAEGFPGGLLEYPHYTRPPEWRGRTIPAVLLSGNHAAIAQWRREQSLGITAARRPELLPPELLLRINFCSGK